LSDETPPPFLDVLHRDERFMVVHKPGGMLVHRGWGRAPVVLVDLVRQHTGQSVVHPVHRLDRGTSGAVLFALDPEMARTLAELFDERLVRKRYLALVRGGAPPEGTAPRGVIDHPLRQHKDAEPVPSTTEYRWLASRERIQPRALSLVAAWPRSGRLHQIRRHLQHLNHPVINDSNYGDTKINRRVRAIYPLKRLGLHAWSIRFPHPETGAEVHVHAPVPEDMAQTYAEMGFDRSVWVAQQEPK
jgi:tRNA pseudouridine65 synthase